MSEKGTINQVKTGTPIHIHTVLNVHERRLIQLEKNNKETDQASLQKKVKELEKKVELLSKNFKSSQKDS